LVAGGWRIAILGTRGIPANYGGFETFAEELSVRLAARGHDVTVYCRSGAEPHSTYRGVRLRNLSTIRHKYFDTIAHTFLSTLHLLAHRVDVALYCNGANAIFTAIPRLFGMPSALNVDGLERKRKKWNRAAKAWYLVSEWLATFLPSEVVTDARAIQDYYRQRYGKRTTFIPYGAETGKVESTAALDELGLEPGRYFLYVSRMEPENHALEVRQAFERVRTDMKLALIGDAPYARDYIREVRDTRDPRIVMPGAIYGQGYHELDSHCFAYIHATEVGGTHPALIEAMGRGALVLYRDTPENAEAAGDAGIRFRDDLAEKMEETLAMSEAERETLRRRARERVARDYCWDAVATAYEVLFRSMRQKGRPERLPQAGGLPHN
jgi:glycosyltransferase involved in cell wall biosynthesis